MNGIDKLIFSIDSAHDEIEEIYKTKKPNIREYFKKIGQIKKEKLNKPYLVVQTFAERSQRDKVMKFKKIWYANT